MDVQLSFMSTSLAVLASYFVSGIPLYNRDL